MHSTACHDTRSNNVDSLLPLDCALLRTTSTGCCSPFAKSVPQCSQVSISLFVQCELVLVGCCKVSLNLADDMMSHGSFSAATWSPTCTARPLEFYVAYIVSKVISCCTCRHTSICSVVSGDLPWPYRTFRSRACTVISNNPVRKF